MDWHFLGFSCLLTRSALFWASLAVCFDGLALSGLLLLAYRIGTPLGFSGSLLLMDWHSSGLLLLAYWIGTSLGSSSSLLLLLTSLLNGFRVKS